MKQYTDIQKLTEALSRVGIDIDKCGSIEFEMLANHCLFMTENNKLLRPFFNHEDYKKYRDMYDKQRTVPKRTKKLSVDEVSAILTAKGIRLVNPTYTDRVTDYNFKRLQSWVGLAARHSAFKLQPESYVCLLHYIGPQSQIPHSDVYILLVYSPNKKQVYSPTITAHVVLSNIKFSVPIAVAWDYLSLKYMLEWLEFVCSKHNVKAGTNLIEASLEKDIL